MPGKAGCRGLKNRAERVYLGATEGVLYRLWFAREYDLRVLFRRVMLQRRVC